MSGAMTILLRMGSPFGLMEANFVVVSLLSKVLHGAHAFREQRKATEPLTSGEFAVKFPANRV